jgi:uncharacterized protein
VEENIKKIVEEYRIGLFLVGSYLYGTNLPQSDKDYMGIFIEPPDYVIGRKRIDEINLSTNKTNKRNNEKDTDLKYYSLRKFFDLAVSNNPNILELFYIPDRNISFKNKYWDLIQSNKHLFLSLKLKHSFTGYAFSQKSKLITKKKRLDALRKFKQMLETTIRNGGTKIKDIPTYLPENEDSKDLGIFQTQAWIKVDGREYEYHMDINKIYDNISREIDRYGTRTSNLDEHMYDTKFASHIFRLYYEGLSLLKEGEIHYPLAENQFILDVKNGRYTLEEVLEKAEQIEPLFEMAYLQSNLRHSPDIELISELQQQIYLKYWKEKKLI